MGGALGSIHDVAEELAVSPRAIANLCTLGAGHRVAEHTHTNPYLWLHALGGYAEAGDAGERVVAGPAAMFFPAGSAHAMAVLERGLAAIIVEFDEASLRRRLGAGVDLRRPRQWVGGGVGRRASRLARSWLAADGEDAVQFALTGSFLAWAFGVEPEREAPAWLCELDAIVNAGEVPPPTAALARRLRVGPVWLARAYRRWRGEGLAETLKRRRVELAALLLETERSGLADVAAAAGFCDQSHMTRAFKLQLGRTPAVIRSARLGLAG